MISMELKSCIYYLECLLLIIASQDLCMAYVCYETPIFVLLSSEAGYCNFFWGLYNGVRSVVPYVVPYSVPYGVLIGVPHYIPNGVPTHVPKDVLNDTVPSEDLNINYKIAPQLVPNVLLHMNFLVILYSNNTP
jgi:hypothetical protein